MSRLLTKSLPFTVVIALSIGLVIFRGAQAPQEPLPTAEMPMTDNEKAESTLYPQYGNLTKLSGLNPGEDVSVMVATAMHFFTKTPEERVRNVVCGADAIIRGEVQEALSHPTSEGTFLFTTYDVVVRDVIKGNPADSLRPGDEIMLSRPGGRLLLSGRSVIAVDENYLRLNVGNSYILYLKRIPQTGDFGPLAPDRSFGAQDTETLRLAREALNRCDAGGAPNAN